MQHQYLTIGGVAGTNADDRDAHGLGDRCGQIARHALEQEHRGARGFKGDGIGLHLPGLCLKAALYFIAAEHVYGLRCQAQVGAHRHTALGQQPDGLGQPGCTFDLDHMGAGLHQRRTVGKGRFGRGVGHERQVGENQCAVIAALDRGGVVGHVCRGDRQGAVMALQDHAQGVAHQQDVDASLAGCLGERRVIAGQHGDFFTLGLQAIEGGKGYFRHVESSSFWRQGKRLHAT